MTSTRLEKAHRWMLRSFVFLTLFSIGGTVFSAVSGIEAEGVARVMSVVLVALGAGLVFLVAERRYGGAGAVRFFLALLGVGVCSEVLGLYTGLPFGRYDYTGGWWPSVALPGGENFPLLLPFAWVMVAGAGLLIGTAWKVGWMGICVGGVIAAVVDLPMEAAMTDALNYWVWLDGGPFFGAPVLNSFGWFGVSVLAGFVGLGGKDSERRQGRTPWFILGFHLLLITAILFVSAGWIAGVVAGGLSLLFLYGGLRFADEVASSSVD